MKTIVNKLMSVALLFSGLGLFAQTDFATTTGSNTYKTAIGLRVGGTDGITVKRHLNESKAIEGILGIWHNGFSVTGLSERYANAGLEGLSWYYGYGGHLAAETRETFYTGYGDRYGGLRQEGLGIGLDGIIGIEYKIPPIPFAISLDLKPFLEVNTAGNAFVALDPGLGIKVTF